MVSELRSSALRHFMAEGTWIRGLDERLGAQEAKVNEVIQEVTKSRSEALQQSKAMNGRMEFMECRIGGMDDSLQEIKDMLAKLQIQGKNDSPS